MTYVMTYVLIMKLKINMSLNRSDYKKIADDTLSKLSDFKPVKSVTYLEAELESLVYRRPNSNPVRVSVVDETTLQTCIRLHKEGYKDLVCLNQASARNPGGGFMNGSNAQEESLARNTSLFKSLETESKLYELNNQLRPNTGLYTTGLIYSPDVVVMKNDVGRVVDNFKIAVITMAACNRSVTARVPAWDTQVGLIMKMRCNYVLRVAASKGHKVLVLGAWGCGVFKQNPRSVVSYFKDAIHNFEGCFDEIIFGVPFSYQNRKEFKKLC